MTDEVCFFFYCNCANMPFPPKLCPTPRPRDMVLWGSFVNISSRPCSSLLTSKIGPWNAKSGNNFFPLTPIFHRFFCGRSRFSNIFRGNKRTYVYVNCVFYHIWDMRQKCMFFWRAASSCKSTNWTTFFPNGDFCGNSISSFSFRLLGFFFNKLVRQNHLLPGGEGITPAMTTFGRTNICECTCRYMFGQTFFMWFQKKSLLPLPRKEWFELSSQRCHIWNRRQPPTLPMQRGRENNSWLSLSPEWTVPILTGSHFFREKKFEKVTFRIHSFPPPRATVAQFRCIAKRLLHAMPKIRTLSAYSACVYTFPT